ncbi:hypothetical protein NB700_001815 [Xanthomonas sacchari]|uniref:Uncharacterized protein n=1 Tax=Xanthomonas sacchari TaxID=56458 RepID=A0ABT3DWE5_9XANT|nr:hypothetical protein [Xanthomonas sacchari]MCW0399259.1 hypothetical protein [Xanthomonas sacchari]
MLTPLLQNQFRPYSVRSHVAAGRGQFTATLCCHGVRVGKIHVTRKREERVDPKSNLTMVLEFDDAAARKNFEAVVDAWRDQLRRSSQSLVIDLVLQMVDAHLGDKRIHDLVRKGHVVYRLSDDPVNTYRVVRGPIGVDHVYQLRRDLAGDLAWIANEAIDIGKGLPKSAAAGRILH